MKARDTQILKCHKKGNFQVPVLKEDIAEYIKVPYTFAPIQSNRQRAASVAALGAVLYQKGIIETAAEHKPDYRRVSQAERELKEKERSFQIC